MYREVNKGEKVMKKFRWLGGVGALLLTLIPNALADETELLNLIKSLQNQMTELQNALKQQSDQIKEQKDEIRELQNRQTRVQVASSAGTEAPQATGMTDAEFKERISNTLGGADQWLKDLRLYGDLRLRYEGIQLSTGDPSDPPDRNRFRLRVRYGLEKTLNPDMKFGFELSSGEQDDGFQNSPASANQTFTNLFNYKNIWISKAYATYTPSFLKIGPIQKVEIGAGKVNNPFEKGASDLVWDRDVKPEGVYEKADIGLFKTDNLDLNFYATASQFVLQESNTKGKDANLFGYQAGIAPSIHLPFLRKPVDILSALSYYDYDNFTRKSNFFIGGVSQANGNFNVDGDPTTLDARNFNIVESYSEVVIYPYNIPARLYFDFARNTREAVPATSLTTPKDDDNAYAVGLKIGEVKNKHDLEATYIYKYLPANSLVGVFTESDFGATGFAGHRGSVIRLGYGLTDSIVLNAAAILVDNTNSGSPGVIDVQQRRFQVDLTWKF